MADVIGIDPGANTGVATITDGALVKLETVAPVLLADLLRERKPARVIFEDSRLEKRAWNARTKTAYGAALATARSLGQVDAWCVLIVSVCEALDIPVYGVSPTVKGAKVNADQFARITGWAGKSNEHTRDAAMVAWPFRRSTR